MDYQNSAQLRKIYEEQFDVRDVPQLLWHYTRSEHLLKILQSGELWFTHVSCLNDTSEVEYAIEVTRQALDRLEQRLQSQRHLNSARAMFLAYARRTMLTNNRDSGWYVASFSECADDLTQWRSYAGGNHGVAIGFSGRGLTRDFASNPKQGASIWKTIYDRAKLDRFADAIGLLTIHKLQEFLQISGARQDDLEQVVSQFTSAWGPLVDELSVVPKNVSYESEREWRLTAQLADYPDEADKLVFLAKETRVSRHLRVTPFGNLDQGPPRLPIERIMLGPALNSRDQEVTERSLRLLLNKLGYHEVIVERSAAPFVGT